MRKFFMEMERNSSIPVRKRASTPGSRRFLKDSAFIDQMGIRERSNILTNQKVEITERMIREGKKGAKRGT
jgi:hypothetical protein